MDHQKNYLKCDELSKNILIFSGHCLTVGQDGELFGSCPYNTHASTLSYATVPQNVSLLDEWMWGPLNCWTVVL